MKKTLILLMLSLSFGWLNAQTAPPTPTPRCEDQEAIGSIAPLVRDVQEHVVPSDGGDHHFTTLYDFGCHYQSTATGPTQYCVTTSFVQASVTPSETGALTNIFQKHFIGANAKGGTATGVNGATATSGGLGAGAVKDCALSCDVTIGLSGSNNGVGISVSFPPSTLWQQEAPAKTSACGAVLDPNFTPSCSAVVPGPIGEIRTTEEPPDPPTGVPSCCPPGEICPGTPSPIIIDVDGHGFHLTDAENGVKFDIRGDGHPIQIGWTAAGAQNAFLALDRNGDGTITSGKELFGNFTAQPQSANPNGFLALAEYDKPENGGNGDGIIDENDAVFSKLRLWIDENHDGISQPNEIHPLPELGIRSLSLGYFESRQTDEFGNQFRYKARINPRKEHRDPRDEGPDGTPGRWAYDVFFVTK